MVRAITQYETTNLMGGTPQATEALAFNVINKELATAGDEKARVKALYRNQQLWSLLLKDIALTSNRLPADLKAQIIDLGVWAMRYSTEAIGRRLPVAPLIAVNRDIAEGLRAQNDARSTMTQAAPAAPSMLAATAV